MLERVDLTSLLSNAAGGALHYERAFHFAAHLRGRTLETRFEVTGGAVLKGRGFEYTLDLGAVDPLPATKVFPPLDDKIALLNTLARHAWNDAADVKFPVLRFDAEIKFLEIAREGQPLRTATEETAWIVGEWQMQRDGRSKVFRVERARASIEGLFESLRADNPFAREVQRSRGKHALWPAPQGEIPVWWSSRAVAKILANGPRELPADFPFRMDPVPGTLHALVTGAHVAENLREQLAWGISVRDVEIDEGRAPGSLRVRLSDAQLIHHGVEGEAVEPLEFEMSLDELFRQFEWFAAVPETTGLPVEGPRHRLLAEITTPAALSTRFPLPGAVPPQHYW